MNPNQLARKAMTAAPYYRIARFMILAALIPSPAFAQAPVPCSVILPDGFDPRGTYSTNTWPGGVVPYEFDANVTAANQAAMLGAMSEWQATAPITFRPRSGDANYLHVQNSAGNSSYIGMVGGAQVVNIFNWNIRFIMVHELGHALGLWHEHQRPDRDTYVQINFGNIQPEYSSNFTVGGAAYGPYDFDSVMHYDGCSFSTCCLAGSTCGCASTCQAITVLPPNQGLQGNIGQRTHLSVGDAATMSYLYCPRIAIGALTASPWSLCQGAGSTAIQHSINLDVFEALAIRAASGSTVRTLVDHQQRAPGSWSDVWDGKDGNNQFVPAGSYAAELEAIHVDSSRTFEYFGPGGTGSCHVYDAQGLAVAPDASVYVLDRLPNLRRKAMHFSSGSPVTCLNEFTPPFGFGTGQLASGLNQGMAVDGVGRLHILDDFGNDRRVTVWNGQTGQWINEYGRGQMWVYNDYPYVAPLYYHAQAQLMYTWANDPAGGGCKVFAFDASTNSLGTLRYRLDPLPADDSNVPTATAIAVDADNNVWVNVLNRGTFVMNHNNQVLRQVGGSFDRILIRQGRIVYSASGDRLYLWDVRGNLLQTMCVAGNTIQGGLWLAGGGGDYLYATRMFSCGNPQGSLWAGSRIRDCSSADFRSAPIVVFPGPTASPVNLSPLDASMCQPASICVDWSDVSGATSYDVYWGTTDPPPFWQNRTVSNACPPNQPGTTCRWYVQPRNGSCIGPAGPAWSYTTGGAADCNTDGTPDSCEQLSDCNTNGTSDICESSGLDCNSNGTPDLCEITGHDCNTNGTLDICETRQSHTAWQLVAATGQGPLPRSNSSLVFDRSNRNALLFGGSAGSTNFGDTWLWNGSIWSAPPSNSPGARNQHAMAFHTARGEVVLFGGSAAGQLGDTWVWNGTSWQNMTPAHSPTARSGHAMVYDSTRSVTVLFGGRAGSTYSAETWEWNGVDWTQRPQTGSPAGRNGHAMAYDPIRAETIMFGGYDGSQYDDTWAWNGTSWAHKPSTNQPTPRFGHSMAFDTARGMTELFGGELGNLNTPASDTWEWNGSTWAMRPLPPPAPPARTGHAMVYDTDHTTLLMFGGTNDTPNVYFGDTWAIIADLRDCDLNGIPDVCEPLGDTNGDTRVDGADVQSFVGCLLVASTSCSCARADMDSNGSATSLDVPLFVNRLLIGT